MNKNVTTTLKPSDYNDSFGFYDHCDVARLLLTSKDLTSHLKHHIRGAVREATNKVTDLKGSGKNIASSISKDAYERILSGITTDLVLEHGVPVSYMNKLVLELTDVTTENIAYIIAKWTTTSVITKEEDKRLNELKLYKTMPEDWDGENKFARYEAAGIELIDKSYKDAIKEGKERGVL
ncbi:MAG TPA: hypothetical protein EYQ21_02875 [Flavobacteriales bacterium]|nr:hypothetical protein [Flavobacteriales bacterium]